MMKSRRSVLAALGTMLPAAAVMAATSKSDPSNPALLQCERPGTGPQAKRMPQVLVQDQDQRKFWFYENLIQDKLVLLSFASVDGEKVFPVIDNLIKVQEMIGDRLGKDVFMYTVTTKPEVDTAESLKAYAEKKGARWQFLSGEPAAVRQILMAFGVMGSAHGVAWVGNEKMGRWLRKPVRLHPIFIAEAVARLSTGAAHKPFLLDMHAA